MEAIAAAYAQTRNAELELRIKDVDWALFEQVYNAVASATAQPEIECSVNIITHTGAAQQPRGQARGQQRTAQQADIMTIIYSTAVAHTSATIPAEPVTKYTRKIVKARHNATAGHIKWSAVVSEEAPLKPFKPANDALVRFKIRASFDFATGADATAGDRASKWRLDLTAIKTGALKDLGPHLKRLREDLFVPVIGSTGALPSGSFIERLPVDLLTSYEIELEYVGASAVTPTPATAPAHIEETAQSMLALINPRHNLDRAYQDVMLALAPMIAASPGMFKNPKYKLKQLVPQVVSMTKNEYYADVWPRLADFYVTDKADGERALVVCGLNAGAIVDTTAFIVRSDSLVTVSAPAGTPLTIADAEIICADPKRGSITPQCYTIHIFDCAALEGRLLANEPFSTRVEVLPRCAEVLQAVFNSGASAGDAPQYTVSAKRFTRLAANAAENKQIITAAAKSVREYAIDGLIFSSAGDASAFAGDTGASAYANTRHYKWKPYAQNTIDFLAVKCPPALMGVKPYIARDGYELFLLFVGISHTARAQMGIGLLPKYKQIFPDVPDGYYPVQFSTSLLPYAYLWYAPADLTAHVHRRIVELSRNDVNTEWVFHRVREDRVVSENYYGNDFRTAESSFINFIDPFNIEDLYQRAGSYFEHTADNIYFAQNKFKRYAITQTLKRVIGARTRWVVDLAAGRGADLHRYQELGVDNALFVDVDATAISELIRRKLALGRRKIIGSLEPTFEPTLEPTAHSANAPMNATAHSANANQCPRPFLTKTASALTVHTLVADLKRPFADTLASMYQFGVAPNCVDLVVCNFALHYFCDTLENLRNFLQLVKKLLKKDGLAMFSVMSGRKVFDLLAAAPSSADDMRPQWNSCVSLGGDAHTPARDQQTECACDLPNAVVKYSIIADYKSAKLEQAGQNIMIKLPFSTTMYSEPLCNLDTVTACAKKLGLAVERNESMGARLSQFEQSNRVLYEKLTADDKKYIDLHHIIVLRAIK